MDEDSSETQRSGKPILTLYPNPSDGEVRLFVTTLGKTFLDIGIYNVLGEMLYHTAEDEIIRSFTKTFDISNMAKGLYFISVKTQYGIETVKLIR